MEYTKIRLDFKHGPKDGLYRVILVKGNPDLFKLSCAFCTIFEATFEHCFLISNNKEDVEYVMAPFLEDGLRNWRYLGKHYLYELPEKFVFTYDTGDGWDFDCKIYKKKVEMKSTKEFILLEGHGLGIWEDNIHSLWAYFDGEVDPESDFEDEEKGISLPWNLEMEKYGDFDNPLDIEKISKSLTRKINSDYRAVLGGENEYIEENNIDIDSLEEQSYDENFDFDASEKDISAQEQESSELKKFFSMLAEKELAEDERARKDFEELKGILGEKEAFNAFRTLLSINVIKKGKDFNKEKFDNSLEDLLKLLKSK